jgi:sec-independent protein translocase protein TatA
MIYGLGMQELLVILAIAMLLFGGKKLPEVGRNLGKAIRGFKESEEETTKELKKEAREGETAGTTSGEETERNDPDENREKSGEEDSDEKPDGSVT